MTEPTQVERRRYFCARCGESMFEYFRSPDGHFGVVTSLGREVGASECEFCCPACGARYRLLDRLDALGQPAVRL
jgi:hypothetical protein